MDTQFLFKVAIENLCGWLAGRQVKMFHSECCL